jgi:PAS domain S-box-containing protein
MRGLRSAVTTTHNDAELIRALLDSAPVAIYYSDSTGASTYVNRAYRQMFGLSPEHSDNDWIIGVHPEDQARIAEAWADFRRRPRPVRWEYRTRPGAAGVRYLSEQLLAADGTAGFVGTIIDVTDVVSARDSLDRMESLFRNTFEQAPIAIVYADRHGKLIRLNPAFCMLLGFAPAELEDKTLDDLTFSEYTALGSLQLARLWNDEIKFADIEMRFKCKDGSGRWVRMTTTLIREHSALPECSVGFLRDISVRVEIAAALQQNKALLEAVIAELPVALLACDAAGRITHCNRAAVELSRHPRVTRSESGLIERDQPTADLYLADGVTPVDVANQPLARALRGETIRNLELVVISHDSTPHTVLVSARRLPDQGDRDRGAVAVMQDITERKESHRELERVHRQLVEASRAAGMAEVADNVLHDVGNVLNSVNISANLVADSIRRSKAPGLRRVAALLQEHVEDIGSFIASDERGKHVPAYLATLGEQLLAEQTATLRELSALRASLEHIREIVTVQQSNAMRCGVAEIVNVADLVEASLRLNADDFASCGVTLRREFSPVPPIVVDKHKVLQILVNLVRNASNACRESGRPDKLLTVRVASDADQLRISVIDNGVGIAAENLVRIFSHGFTTRKHGHGFGLHSCTLAAQDLGGSLHAESGGLGRGATFILELPHSPASSHRV